MRPQSVARLRHSRGYTLVECLVVLALISVAMTTVTFALHHLHRLTRQVVTAEETAQNWHLFLTRLRADAHAAQTANLAGDAPAGMLRLEMPASHIVEYELGPQGIDRRVLAGEEVRHRESWRLGWSQAGTWAVQAEGLYPLITLQVPTAGSVESEAAPHRDQQHLFVVGLLHPLSAPRTP